MQFSRRQILGFGAGGLAIAGIAGTAPKILFAQSAPTDQRLVFLLLRGALDGIHAVPPIGDPAYASLRGSEAIENAIRLDSTFGLHPAMANLGELYQGNQAVIAHAVASPYRGRSHFDAQNALEGGTAEPYGSDVGWLNRLMTDIGDESAMAMAENIPLVLRGPEEVTSYAVARSDAPDDDLVMRVTRMYENDATLRPMWEEAVEAQAIAGGFTDSDRSQSADVRLAQLIVQFMNAEDGARIVMAESSGWDTHVGQANRLQSKLSGLDSFIGTLRDGLGPAWQNTMLLVVTEFGRTARINGNRGTDHGTAGTAILAGGGLRGGRVISDWPGVASGQLLEARDLRPTTPLYGLIAGAIGEHYERDPSAMMRTLFPEAARERPVTGIVA